MSIPTVSIADSENRVLIPTVSIADSENQVLIPTVSIADSENQVSIPTVSIADGENRMSIPKNVRNIEQLSVPDCFPVRPAKANPEAIRT